MGKKSSPNKGAKIEVLTEATSESAASSELPSKKTSKRPYVFVGLFALLLIVILATGGLWYKNSRKSDPYDPKTVSQVIQNVGNHIILPNGETPKVVRVTNPDLLKNNNFFVNSKKDDRVLIYRQSNMVILYRPSIDKIVKVIYVDPNSTKTSN